MADNSVFTDMTVQVPNKNMFDLSHSHKTTMKFGDLVPIMIKECLPNDTISLSLSQMVRLLPLTTPTMADIEVFTHTFFVPNRIIWPDFENFIRGPRAKGDTVVPVAPKFGSGANGVLENVQKSSLANYLGLPVGFKCAISGEEFNVSALPFGAYQRVFWDYFRDENLDGALEEFIPLPSGIITNGIYAQDMTKIRKRAWAHDYFTSALPFAQKGDPVAIPILGTGDVEYIGGEESGYFRNSTNGALGNEANPNISGGLLYGDNSIPQDYDPNGTLRALITNISTTIKDLRTATALQKFLEKNARAGNRYFEYTRAVFGQVSPDKRLQRAEYVGGSKHIFNISEVLQTSATTSNSPLGSQGGHAISVGSSDTSTYHCEEHGFIITIMSVRPKASYTQGLEKMWRRFDRFDYPLPDFAHIGEQEVNNYELYFDKTKNVADNVAAFGYMPRYAEMKTANDRVSGEFLDSLEPWVMARKFATAPMLNKDFIYCTPTNEIFPVSLANMTDYVLVDTYFNLRKSSTLPRFDVPQLV